MPTTVTNLDITLPAPQYFDNVTTITVLQHKWDTNVVADARPATASSSYAYNVIWTQNGFDTTNSTIMNYSANLPGYDRRLLLARDG